MIARGGFYLYGVSKIGRLRLFTLAIIAYMLLAFSWWSILLFLKNQDAFDAKAELLQIGMVAEQRIENDAQFYKSIEYQELYQDYHRQEIMILGEAIVFIITLVLGIYLVNRSYRREVESARQQRNFLLSITHELKSPLTGIKLSLETIKKRVLPDKVRIQLSDNAISETSRLTSLVEDLLLSAKLDTTYIPNMEPIDLGLLASEWIDRLKSKYPSVNFNLILDGEELTILGDQYGLGSVFSNLLENAVKYLGTGTDVGLGVFERDKNVLIQIKDNGLGIHNSEKKRVLKKFYRVGNEDTRQTKGTGLGLYIVNEVVQAHHGNLDIEDNKPQGTVFNICLPFGDVS